MYREWNIPGQYFLACHLLVIYYYHLLIINIEQILVSASTNTEHIINIERILPSAYTNTERYPSDEVKRKHARSNWHTILAVFDLHVQSQGSEYIIPFTYQRPHLPFTYNQHLQEISTEWSSPTSYLQWNNQHRGTRSQHLHVSSSTQYHLLIINIEQLLSRHLQEIIYWEKKKKGSRSSKFLIYLGFAPNMSLFHGCMDWQKKKRATVQG